MGRPAPLRPFAGFDAGNRRRFRAEGRKLGTATHAPGPRLASEPDAGTALWYDRSLPLSRFLLNRDLGEAEYVAAAALDWEAANAARASVRHAYQRRAMRFDALARRLSWRSRNGE